MSNLSEQKQWICRLAVAVAMVVSGAQASAGTDVNLSENAGADGSSKAQGSSFRNVADGNLDTYWSPMGSTGRVSVKWTSATTVNTVIISEAAGFEGHTGSWELRDHSTDRLLASGVGAGLIRFDDVILTKLDFNILTANDVPGIAEFETYYSVDSNTSDTADGVNDDYVFCANEGESCILPGSGTVRYGANGKYVYQNASGSIVCDNSAFGQDPVAGVTKACYYSSNGKRADYLFCSNERENCSFPGTRTIRYGIDGNYTYLVATDGIRCDNSIFDDPAPGLVKSCYYSVKAEADDYLFCSNEHATCSFAGTRTIRYGINGQYNYLQATGQVDCSNLFFGDPAPGVEKSCYSSRAQSAGEYVFCAEERSQCEFSGTRTVRYGAQGKYVYQSATDGISCDNTAFTDPVPGSPKSCYYYSKEFIHPGVLNTAADFSNMAEKVAAFEEPWSHAFTALEESSLSQLGRSPAPLSVLIRGGDGSNFGRVINELKFAYALALRWKVSGDQRYGELAVRYLDAWSATLTSIQGNSDRFLASGLYGYQFANIGEIMRSYSGWSEVGRRRLANMLVTVFYPMNHDFLVNHNTACISNYWANWDMANLAAMMAIGIYADRRDIFDEALDYMYRGEGNGSLDNLLYFRHAANLGQYQESGRDQGHATLGVSLYGAISKMAWNQGHDLFSYNNHELLALSEYIARYNLFEDVPYVPYGPNCRSATTAQTEIASAGRGKLRPSWALIYNHYRNLLGLAAPWSETISSGVDPEIPGNGDEPGWGTLTESIPPMKTGKIPPRGLVALLNGGDVELSWWGAAGAERYQVNRALTESGTFNTIATIAADQPLTFTDKGASRGPRYFYQVTATSSAGVSQPSNTISISTEPQLILHLTFDRQSDLKGLSLMNGAKLEPGKTGNAMSFDGIDDYVALPSGIVSQLSDFTVASWVYLDNGRNWARLFDFGKNDQNYMTFVPLTGSGQSCFMISKVSSYAEQRVCAESVPVGQWTHVAITRSGDTVTLYLNAEAVASGDNISMAPFQLGADSNNWLGRSHYVSDRYLDGRVDDFRVYNGALSETELNVLVSP